MTDPESPAFPRATPLDNEVESRGLTKREYFAAMALNNIPWKIIKTEPQVFAQSAQWAVQMADALIEELNKGKAK